MLKVPKIAIWGAKLAIFSSFSLYSFPRCEEFIVRKFLVPRFSARNALTSDCAYVSTIKRMCIGGKIIIFFYEN